MPKTDQKWKKWNFYCIGAAICTHWEIQCLPYGGFLDAQASQDEMIVTDWRTHKPKPNLLDISDISDLTDLPDLPDQQQQQGFRDLGI